MIIDNTEEDFWTTDPYPEELTEEVKEKKTLVFNSRLNNKNSYPHIRLANKKGV